MRSPSITAQSNLAVDRTLSSAAWWSGPGGRTRRGSAGAARSPRPFGLALWAREAIVPAQSAHVVAASLLGRELGFKLSLRPRLICARDLFHDMLDLLASRTSRDWSDSS